MNKRRGAFMALARLHRQPESTLKNGNCAFNAFALALTDEWVLHRIELSLKYDGLDPNQRFAGFIRRATDVLKTEKDWYAVKSKMLSMRTNDVIALQKTMAPVFRAMAVKLAQDDADKIFHYLQTKEPLMSAFDEYCRLNMKLAVRNEDDIFIRHGFIKYKFQQIYREQTDEVGQQKLLDNWWWSEGYNTFINEMGRDGVYAGDLELARLARYFNVVLKAVGDQFEHIVYGVNGSFPFLHGDAAKNIPKQNIRDIMDCLYDREILMRDVRTSSNDKSIEFSVDITELGLIARRLKKIPEYERVSVFIGDHMDKLKGEAVPTDWPYVCIKELIQRNVISSVKNSGSYVFCMDAPGAAIAIDEVPCRDEIMKICAENFREHPLLVLYNPETNNPQTKHWENTRPVLSPGEKLKRRAGLLFDHAVPNINSLLFERKTSGEDIVRRLT